MINEVNKINFKINQINFKILIKKRIKKLNKRIKIKISYEE